MAHDATKILLGATKWSGREVTSFAVDPATYKAGLAVRMSAAGGLELTDDNSKPLIGISLGRDLSNTKQTAVVRDGLGVPLRLKSYAATGTVTITSYANLIDAGFDTIEVAGVVFTAQAGAATLGTATFRAATSNAATATSLAAQINAHATTGALVTATADGDDVDIVADTAGAGGNALTLVYDDNGTATIGATVSAATLANGSNGIAVHGARVYTNDAGLGCKSGDADATATNGSYDGGVLTGVDEDASTVYVALVDMPGGL